MNKLTSNDIDNRLIDLNIPIKRLDEIVGMGIRIEWICLKNECEHIWVARPNDVIRKKSKCPKCSTQLKLTNEIVDQKLKEHGRDHLIERYDDIKGAHKYNLWKCKKQNCLHVWKAVPNNILNCNTGCPKCNILTDNNVDERIANRNIFRMDNIVNSNYKIRWKCLNIRNEHICNFIWKSTPNNILVGNSNCPQCSIDNKTGNKNSNFNGHEEIRGNYFRNLQINASNREIEFCLDIKFIWELYLKQNRKCALSGVDICFGSYAKHGTRQTASLDRIDSLKGYTEENVQWVHKDINKMKQHFDDEKFIEWCHIISKYNTIH